MFGEIPLAEELPASGQEDEPVSPVKLQCKTKGFEGSLPGMFHKNAVLIKERLGMAHRCNDSLSCCA